MGACDARIVQCSPRLNASRDALTVVTAAPYPCTCLSICLALTASAPTQSQQQLLSSCTTSRRLPICRCIIGSPSGVQGVDPQLLPVLGLDRDRLAVGLLHLAQPHLVLHVVLVDPAGARARLTLATRGLGDTLLLFLPVTHFGEIVRRRLGASGGASSGSPRMWWRTWLLTA